MRKRHGLEKACAHALRAGSLLALPGQENRRPELAPAHSDSAAAVVSRPAPRLPRPPDPAPPGSRSAAEVEVEVQSGADRPELKVGVRGPPPATERVLLSYPPPVPSLAPTAHSRAAERGPRAGRGKGVGRSPGTSWGQRGRGAPLHRCLHGHRLRRGRGH